MEPKRDLAIVLRSVAYEERHRIVTALTEQHGVVSVMARNAIQSRRFGGALDIFSASEWLLVEKPGSELWRVDEAKIRRPFEGLRKDFEKLSLASVFNELILKLAPRQQACPDLFRLHSNALACLDEPTESGGFGRREISLLNGYLAKLLQWSGSQPQLLTCRGCQGPLEVMPADAELSCRIDDAGWLCPSCRDSHQRRETGEHGFSRSFLRISPMAALDFHICLLLPIRQIPASIQGTMEEQRGLFRFLEALFAFHLPGFDQKPLNGLRFLGLESNLQPQGANPR